MEELLTKLESSQSILVDSTIGISNMQSLKLSAVMCYTQYLATINSLEKLLASTLFCILLYRMMIYLFKKTIKPVWPRRVTLLYAWEAFTYAVVLTGTHLVYENICEGGNCSAASRY